MKPRWRKVLHDLIDNKGRTLLVVFSIAVGVFSIGVIAGAYQIISNDMGISYASNNPANIEMRMSNFDDDVLSSIRNQRDVEDAEARRVFNMRVRLPGTEKWTTFDVIAFESFEDNTINLLKPIEGAAMPGKREILLEKDAFEALKVNVGDLLEFQLPDGSTKTLPVVGIVQDTAAGAGDFLADPFAYISTDTLQYLGQPKLYNRALVTVSYGGDDLQPIREESVGDFSTDPFAYIMKGVLRFLEQLKLYNSAPVTVPRDGDNPHYIREVGGEVKDKIEGGDIDVIRSRFSETHKHPLGSTINAVLGILLALGVLIVLLSSSLIANTLSALLNQHLRHIGVIKLVGGQRKQVFRMYLTLIMAFGILALLIAVPLGGRGAYALAEFIATKLSFSLLGYRIVPIAFIVQIGVGLFVPLIAGLAPVINGSRITVLKALSGDLAEDEVQFKDGEMRLSWFDWAQVKVTRLLAARGIHIPRPFIISLRNTFRRKSRLWLTLFTLTMGGAIFISVFNVRVTLHDYIGQIGKYFRADVTLDFDQAYRLKEVKKAVMDVDGVVDVEGWQFASGELMDDQKNVIENITLLGPPAESKLVQPLLIDGRWLRTDDVRKMAVSESLTQSFPGLKAGDYIKMRINGHDEVWQVIGIFKFVSQEGVLGYAPYEYISEMNNQANRSFSFRVVTEQHDRAYQNAKAEELDKYMRDKGYKVRVSEAGSASLDAAVESLDILVVFLLIMAVLTAIVGSMGLTGTMGMNVLERTREIGITRAIGADDRAVMRTVIAEGIVIGSISFALAIILSIPFTYGLSTIVSLAIFQTPITVVFTYLGYAIWLALVLVLSTFASILPARNAARLTIREVLAYE
ncbi:MAG: ABC transporter permease [Anaerolineales bacterium]|nr:ABC transporter permease [Anaerolineales bacterium]